MENLNLGLLSVKRPWGGGALYFFPLLPNIFLVTVSFSLMCLTLIAFVCLFFHVKGWGIAQW